MSFPLPVASTASPALQQIGVVSNGNKVYDDGDLTGRMPLERRQVAEAFASAVDPARTPIVALGEAHSDRADDQAFEIASALKAAGKPMVVGIETPTNTRLTSLVSDYQRGRIGTEAFLDRGSAELAAMYNAQVADPSKRRDADFYRPRLQNDVVRYTEAGIPVAMIDVNRYGRSGTRDDGMAGETMRLKGLVEATGAYNGLPARGVLLQVGMIHAQKEAALPLLASELDPKQSRSGDARTAPIGSDTLVRQLERAYGDEKVLAVALDPVDTLTLGAFEPRTEARYSSTLTRGAFVEVDPAKFKPIPINTFDILLGVDNELGSYDQRENFLPAEDAIVGVR